jgi:mRNA interferase MazF
MAVTSQLRPATSLGEVWIGNWQGAGLLKPSAIKPVFAALEQSLILKQLGTLQSTDQTALRASISSILG